MKPDQHYISRLELGDKLQNTRGETVEVTEIRRDGSITAATVGTGYRYLRLYDKMGLGSPASGQLKTP